MYWYAKLPPLNTKLHTPCYYSAAPHFGLRNSLVFRVYASPYLLPVYHLNTLGPNVNNLVRLIYFKKARATPKKKPVYNPSYCFNTMFKSRYEPIFYPIYLAN